MNNIKYQIRKSKRAKHIRLSIYHDGKVVATLPRWGTIEALEDFVAKKSSWIQKKLQYFTKRYSGAVRLPKRNRKDFLINRENARRIIKNRLENYCSIYGVDYKNLYIRNQKTRWGSCSIGGNLSFSYRLIYLPQKLRNYIIVHEICHRKEFNHSSKFWQLVEETIPDYKQCRKELRKMI